MTTQALLTLEGRTKALCYWRSNRGPESISLRLSVTPLGVPAAHLLSLFSHSGDKDKYQLTFTVGVVIAP